MDNYLEMLKRLRSDNKTKSEDEPVGDLPEINATSGYRVRAHVKADKFWWSKRITTDAQGRAVNRPLHDNGSIDYAAPKAECNDRLRPSYAEFIEAMQMIEVPAGVSSSQMAEIADRVARYLECKSIK